MRKRHSATHRKLGLAGSDKLDLSVWKANLADRWDSLVEPVRISLVGEFEFEFRTLGSKVIAKDRRAGEPWSWD